MADTVTATIELIKPQVGASDGSWGGKINDNFDAIDAALASATNNALRSEAAIDALPVIASRAGKVLAFDADGNPTVATIGSADAGLRDDLVADDGSGLVQFNRGETGASGHSVETKIRESLSAADFIPNSVWQGMLVGTVVNVATYVQAAYDAAKLANKDVFLPAGIYRMNTKITAKSSSLSTQIIGMNAFVSGPRFYGEGRGKTILLSYVSNDYLFDIDSDFDHTLGFKTLWGVGIEDMSITCHSSTTGASGVVIRTTYSARIENVDITGFDNDGLKISVIEGDNDSSTSIELKHVAVFNCGRWGIDAKAASGHNEINALSLDQVWVQECGTAGTFQATPSTANLPTSGGMRWKGQVVSITNSTFTINQNIALLIPGESGLASNAYLANVAFENNIQRQLLVTGIKNFIGQNLQFYNNDTYIARVACEFYAGEFAIRNAKIRGVLVRATTNNSNYIAFKATKEFSYGFTNVCVEDITWDNFGYTGQTGLSGIEGPRIPMDGILTFTSTGTVTLVPTDAGNIVPIRRRSPITGNVFETGEYLSYRLQAAGRSVDGTGLGDGTYHVYLADDVGVPNLKLSTATPARDTVSGYMVRNDLTGWVWVGKAVFSGGNVVTTAAANFANAPYIKGFGFQWIDSTGAVRCKTTAPTTDTDGSLV